MDIKHLSCFAAIAQYGSMNKAAQALYISQPHLSRMIKELETQLGFPLLVRTQQGCTLTEKGNSFLERCKNVLFELEQLNMLSFPTQKAFTNHLYVSMTKFTHIMESFNQICEENQNLPEFRFRLNEGSAQDVLEDVSGAFSNIGVFHFSASNQNQIMKVAIEHGLSCTVLGTLSPCIILSQNHELIRNHEEINLANISNYGFVIYDEMYNGNDYLDIEQMLDQKLFSLPKTIYVRGRSALLHLIGSTNFFSIGIISFLNQNELYKCVSVPIKNSEKIRFAVLTRGIDELSDMEKAFLVNIKEKFSSLEKADTELNQAN